jgi:uncharacterized protein DUF3592
MMGAVIATGLLLIQPGTTTGEIADGAARLQLAALVVGAVLVARGLTGMLRSHRWCARACRETGRVVDHVCLGRRYHKFHAPIVEFDVGGARVRFVGNGAGYDARPIGARVPVLYNPDDPGQARLADFKTAPSWWLIVGLAVVVTSFVAI